MTVGSSPRATGDFRPRCSTRVAFVPLVGPRSKTVTPVLDEIGLLAQPRARHDQLLTCQVADVNRLLEPLAMVQSNLEDSSRPTRVPDVIHQETANAVGHRSACREWTVLLGLPFDHGCKLSHLNLHRASIGHTS
jgi:hypothetical protein